MRLDFSNVNTGPAGNSEAAAMDGGASNPTGVLSHSDGGVAAPSRSRLPFLLLAVIASLLFGIRLAAPPNLLDQDQERPAAYVLDILKNGHWLCQQDLSGAIASKPPVWAWLAALASLATGRVNEFSLYVPGALAALGTAWLVFGFGRKEFGTGAAFLGGVACMLTTAGAKAFGLARTDSVFAFTVTATALLAFRAWTQGRGWTWFWLMASVATLTKGPLGLALGASGLLAAWWERKRPEPLPLRGSQLAGTVLFLIVCGGWVALAFWQFGPAVPEKLFQRELASHSVAAGGRFPGSLFWQPPLYYLGRAAPWSLLAYWGLWRIWKRPAQSSPERRFERFLFCWFVLGLFLFSMAPHQRADLLWPIMPAGALIAGRQLNALAGRWCSAAGPCGPQRGGLPARFCAWFAVAVALGIAGIAAYYFGPHARAAVVRQTVALKALADEIRARGGAEFPLTHVDDRLALHAYLGAWRPWTSFERAARLLRGAEPAYVAVSNFERLEAARRPGDPMTFTILPPAHRAGQCPTRIVANRANLLVRDSFAFCSGSLLLKVRNARLLHAGSRFFCFRAAGPEPHVLVQNDSEQAREITVCWHAERDRRQSHRVLRSGEEWRVGPQGQGADGAASAPPNLNSPAPPPSIRCASANVDSKL
jgi:4-amino-4-deoxy-L-arabinose transferase-like glycosyltransferase